MKTFQSKIIGEIGSNHMGSIIQGKQLIDICKKIGCSCVKFQLWRADDLYKNTSIYDATKKLEISFDMGKQLFMHGKEKNIDVFFSVFYLDAIDFCEEIGVKYYKVAARSINDYDLLKKTASTKKPVFISLSKEYPHDLSKIKNIFKKNNVIFMYTVSKYPPQLNDFSFNNFKEIIQNGGGYSNHFINLYASQIAMFLGASWIELHIMLEKGCEKSPDVVCSITTSQLKELITWQNKIKFLMSKKI